MDKHQHTHLHAHPAEHTHEHGHLSKPTRAHEERGMGTHAHEHNQPLTAEANSALREKIAGLKFKDPEDAGYVRAYAYGWNEAIDRVLESVTNG